MKYGPIENWDVSEVTHMSQLFRHKGTLNADLSKWDVSNVTSMVGMFSGATQFNSDISNWMVSKVTNMWSMFDNAFNFNSDVSKWMVSKVISMSHMFNDAKLFNSDVTKWVVLKVTTMQNMFTNSGFKRTLCDSKWESLDGNKNAFNNLGNGNSDKGTTSSTARYGCCPSNKYMSAPNLNPFSIATSCSACPKGRASANIVPNDDTVNIICLRECPKTQILNSDKAAAADSLTGIIDASVTITCDSGWSGSGTTVCGKDLQWNPVRVCSGKSCAATQIANSDKAETNSITGKLL